jgi:hypothetical protein
MKQVVGRRFTDDLVNLEGIGEIDRKLGFVPIPPKLKLQIEEMDFFLGCGADLRVLAQVAIEGGCTALLRADNGKVDEFAGHGMAIEERDYYS